MADTTRTFRRACIFLLAVAACNMVATQLNYILIGNIHLITVLAPIITCALLFGTIPATVVGLLVGLTEFGHAIVLPLDTYEAFFAIPTNSIFLFPFIGLITGMMYAFGARLDIRTPSRQLLALFGIAAISSIVFTTVFSLSSLVAASMVELGISRRIGSQFTNNGEAIGQILANFVLTSVVMSATVQFNQRRLTRTQERSLRETFQGWLAAVMAIAYLVTGTISYTAISYSCRASAENKMQSQVDYLLGQLNERDKLLEGVARRTSLTDTKLEEIHQSSIGGLANALPLGTRGISAVAENGIIVSSSNPTYTGRQFTEVVGDGLVGGFDETLYDQTSSTQWYMDGGEVGFIRAAQMGFVRVSQQGSYQVMAALPSSEVYALRPVSMVAISVVFLLLFVIVYAQASLLLKNVVVRGIDETNETLALITGGDLDQQVKVHDSVEFVNLSQGINATVSALKSAIVAEGARIERDLSTAKSIQESALPGTFPPYPDISSFDIYASMNAAREVGGDFYDFFLIDDQTLGFLIADVSGKGIPASLFMMAAKTELYNYMASGMSLEQAVESANYHLCQGNNAGMFVTVWAAKLNHKTGELTYVNAGHNPPLLRHNGSWSWLNKRGGLFLGSFDTAKYRSSTLTLEPGDQILLYTDGVSEAFNVNEDLYGEDRLMQFASEHADLHPHALVDGLRDELRAWAAGAEQSDDITMLSLEYGVPPEATGSITIVATLDHLDDVFALVHKELAQRLCPIQVQNQLDVAIEEMLVNVCNYAYADKDEPGICQVDYVYHAHPNTITIQITDWGVPFNPLTREDPTIPSSIQEAKIGGLGILMTKRMTDDMVYLRDGDANVLAFKKSW